MKSSRAAAGLAWVARLRRLGLVGFAFFFFKGLLWLALPFIARHLMA